MNKTLRLLPIILFAQLFSLAQNNADSLLSFIVANKHRSSVYLVENDSVVASLNENKLMPLASTVKLMVAIEFAKQAGAKVINPESLVSFTELDKYYIPHTDAGAHPAWIEYEKKQQHVSDGQVKLLDVARGMIMFSSNANTEFLMDLLGVNNVTNNIQLLRLRQHTPIYPIVASLFFYQNPRNKKEENILKEINKLTDDQYSLYANQLHNALKYDTVLKSRFRPQDLTENMQRVWTKRLPSSTTKDYAQVANVLNNRRYFDTAAYGILSYVLEFVMDNPANQQWLKHAGMKGGSTAWVLTKTLYATTKQGARIEMAYFFNGLAPGETKKLQGWMNDFELKILTDKLFRTQAAKLLQ